MEENTKAVQIWDNALSMALKIPGALVDRKDFLKKELSLHCNEQQLNDILEGRLKTTEVLTKKRIQKLAKGSIKYHRNLASMASGFAGLPGGLGLAAAIPADMAQYLYHVIILIQKLLYLYGVPDLRNSNNEIDDELKNIITLFIGVSMGADLASRGAKEFLKKLAKEVAIRIPRKALTKTALYNIAKQTAKWIGIKLTKDQFGKALGKIVPLIGFPISASFTYITFTNMSRKLKNHLDTEVLENLEQ